jgi:hypothetical protein
MGLLRGFGRPAALSKEAISMRVLQDLENVLNSKLDYASFMPGFGVKDVSEYNNKDDLIKLIIEEIERNVNAWLPSIEVVSIMSIPEGDLSRIHAKIDYRLRDTGNILHIYTDLGTRQWEVSEK